MLALTLFALYTTHMLNGNFEEKLPPSHIHSARELCIAGDIQNIGEKIWRNECGGVFENLTHWGEGEEFASFGIGHFIWYPAGKRGPFEEGFPELVKFLTKQHVELPSWVKEGASCPWKTREEFYAQFTSNPMQELRDSLFKTRHLQVLFIKERLDKAFPLMTADLSRIEQEKITAYFHKLSETSRGLYALIDYVNFKGSGTSPSESYQGHRWGLLQVLLAMQPSADPLDAFALAAKKILTQRVALSPPERNEKKWLPGWINRINTYLQK